MKKYLFLVLLPIILLNSKSAAQAVLGISQYSYYIAHDTVPANTSDSISIWVINRGSTAFNDNLQILAAVQDTGSVSFHPVDTTYSAIPVSIAAGDSIRFPLLPYYDVVTSLRYHYDINVIVIWPAATSISTSDSLFYNEVIILHTGINEIDLNKYIKAYPNPSTTTLTIENRSKMQVEEVRIYDTKGELITTVKKQSVIDTESWPAGMYLIDIVFENKQKQTIRVVKQK